MKQPQSFNGTTGQFAMQESRIQLFNEQFPPNTASLYISDSLLISLIAIVKVYYIYVLESMYKKRQTESVFVTRVTFILL